MMKTARLMFGIGWETGPAVFLGFVAVSIAGSAVPLAFSLGLRPLVDGMHDDRSGDLIRGAVVCGLSAFLLAVFPHASRFFNTRIRERSIMVLQRRLLVLSSTPPGLEHFERADYWDRLQLLKRNFGDLLMGMANVLLGPLILAQLLVTAVVLGRLQPILLVLPLLAFPAVWLNKRAEVWRQRGQERAAEPRRQVHHVFSLAAESRSGREIRVYGLDRELLQRHERLSGTILQATETASFRAVALSVAGWLIFGLGYAGAVFIGLRAAAGGRLTAGDVALTLTLAAALVTVAGRVSEIVGLLMRAVAVADHYQWLDSAARPAAPQAPPAAVPARLRAGFELRDVEFRYPGTERPALTGVDLTLAAGTVVALVGENGAGKTTLVKLLTRMYAPAHGEIRLDGTDLAGFDIAAYRRRLAAGFQDFVRFELPTAESVGVGDVLRIDDLDAVRRALGKANADFVEALPDGLRTSLGRSWQGGVDLSGGQWQKLALARAMMRDDPFLVVFDEPTAALDPQTEHALFEQIAREMRAGAATGRITVLVSHRFSTVRMADLIVVLDEGRIVEQGSHDELVARGGLYAELYGLQARAYQQ